MRRVLFSLGLLAASAAGASAQPGAQYPTQPFPGYQYGLPGYGPAVNPNNFMPNIYNPQSQPLSPYLNMLHGTNAAASYYYGVRPGTLGAGGRGYNNAPFMAMGGNRAQFFPQLAAGPEPLGTTILSGGAVLPPAGHPVVFSNTLGFFPGGGPAGGARPGLSGVGNAKPPGQ